MAEAYTEKFHIPFNFIMNSVNIEMFHHNSKVKSNTIYFVYAGGLHLERWKALSEISKAIDEIKADAKLYIYTDEEKAKLYRSKFLANTEFKKPVFHSQINEVYENADVLVHVEVNNPMLVGFFKYSISTKIPEYLASGRTILFYGPHELGLYRYLEDNKVAYLADNYSQLCKMIRTIISKENESEILENAYSLAQAEHDSSRARTILHDSIIECCAELRE